MMLLHLGRLTAGRSARSSWALAQTIWISASTSRSIPVAQRAPFRASSTAPDSIPQLESRSIPTPTADSVLASIADGGDPPAKGVTLRPYQQAAIQACLDALDSGTTRMGVSSPTGSGKTTMFMKLIPRIIERDDQEDSSGGLGRERKKTLILVNAVELAIQAENAARRLLPEDWTIEVEQGKREASGHADVTIATVQTLHSSGRLGKFSPEDYGLVIVDEAHHAAAKGYLQLLHHFNHGVTLPKSRGGHHKREHGNMVPIIGFSATFSRPDQLALSAAFEKIVFHREIGKMLKDGWLSPAKSTSVHADLHLDEVKLSSLGDFNTSELSNKMSTPHINNLVLKSYQHLAAERRSTLIFCVDLSHVDQIVHVFKQAGIDARSVSSTSKPAYRRDTLQSFMNGEFPVLVNCEVLTEGADIPVIDCIILARPTKSKNLLAQMIGRGLRLSPDTGKGDCHIIDIADTMSRGLVVTPTLLGLSHDDIDVAKEEREGEERTGQGEEVQNRASHPGGSKYNVRFIDEQDPFGLEDDTGGRVRLGKSQMSWNAWVACGDNRYVLDLMTKTQDYVQIEPSGRDDPGRYCISHHWKFRPILRDRVTVLNRTKILAYADDLERAFATADAFALNKVGRDKSLQLQRYAAWRQRPASPKAIALLLKMKGVEDCTGDLGQPMIRVSNKLVEPDQLTAGEVSAFVCATNRGAFSKKRREDERAENAAARRIAKEERMNRVDLPLPAET